MKQLASAVGSRSFRVAKASARVLCFPWRLLFAGRRRRRVWSGVLVVGSALLILGTPTGGRVLSPAQDAARGHMYGLATWEVVNFGSKWFHRLGEILTGRNPSPAHDRAGLERYLEMNARIDQVRTDLDRAAGQRGAEVAALQETLDALKRERRALRDDLEEYLEGVISQVLRDLDIGELGPLTWPPVDFRLDAAPRVLVTSPRDRIERLESVLIDPGIGVPDMEKIERRLLAGHNLAAAVLRTGGVATFPTVVPEGRDLLPTLEVAAHEWLHAYLFFKLLGQAYWRDADMTTLNETLADIFGREVGREAYTRLTGEPPPGPEDPTLDGDTAGTGGDPAEFDFRTFMQATRQRTDELLAAGEVEGAEAYMEQRRLELQGHGTYIRVLNQAYFAFHGTYGESPSSVSPIADQLKELRGHLPDAGALVKALQGVRSYDGFLALLAKYRAPDA